MGVNLTLVLGHSLGAAELLAFPERASASLEMQRAARQLWQVVRPRWPNLGGVEEFATIVDCERLTEDEVQAAWARGDTPSFKWAGFNLYFGRRAVEATHLERLAAFALDLDQLRAPLQACARALAGELRSPSIVYGPDSSSPFEAALDVVADSSLSEIIAVATRSCGAPARSMRDMVVGDDGMPLDKDGYFIEVVDL
jgi:hypothetical protein